MITNNTFCNNHGENGGGGIRNSGSNLTVRNTILWGDTPDEIKWNFGALTVTYSDIQGGWGGEGNIDAGPLFVDPDNGDHHLQAGSPCINTGDPSSPPDEDGTRADMGALYFDQSSAEEQLDLALSARWNLISLPLSVQDSTVSTLFPNAISAFKFDNGYQQVTDMSMGRGYWLNLPSDGTYPIVGMPVHALTLPLQARWNLVGGISDTVSFSSIQQDPPNSIISVFRFDNGYQQETEALIPGEGYWINAANVCALGLGGGVSAKGIAVAEGRERRSVSGTGWCVPVKVSSGGKKVNVVFGMHPEGTDGIDASLGEVELPPSPPAGSFDVRWRGKKMGGSWVDLRGMGEGEEEYLLTWQRSEEDGFVELRWEARSLPEEGAFFIADGIGTVMNMRESGILRIEDSGIQSVMVRYVDRTWELPDE